MKEQLEMTIRIYNQVLDWYKSAESKAQIILSILSSFIVFSTGIIFSNSDNFQKAVAIFDLWIYLSLSFTATSMVYGLVCAFLCLRSRLNIEPTKKENETVTYPEKDMYFFLNHTHHSPDILFTSLKELNIEKQLNVYSFQIIALSKNVKSKHKNVNRGFFALCLSVIFLLITVIQYLSKL
jgi:hypothetical protein